MTAIGWEAKRHLMVLILVLLAIAACESPIHATFDVDPNADLSRYASYAWIPTEPPAGAASAAVARHGGYVSPLERQRIERAVERELAARGYTKAAGPSQADLLVAYAVGKEQKTKLTSVAGRTYTYYQGHSSGSGFGGQATQLRSYKEGTLIVEFYDRATSQAIWIGVGSKRLTRDDDSEEALRTAVAVILEPFPSRAQ